MRIEKPDQGTMEIDEMVGEKPYARPKRIRPAPPYQPLLSFPNVITSDQELCAVTPFAPEDLPALLNLVSRTRYLDMDRTSIIHKISPTKPWTPSPILIYRTKPIHVHVPP